MSDARSRIDSGALADIDELLTDITTYMNVLGAPYRDTFPLDEPAAEKPELTPPPKRPPIG